MPSIHKRATQVVVRPLVRGAGSTDKVVLGTIGELNRHAPVGQKPEPKPWKQASRSYPRFRAGKIMTRRNAGRDDGRTWMSGRYVCGAGFEEDCSDEAGRDEVDESEMAMEDEGRRDGRMEVAIVDIAKPMKLRGSTRGYEVVDTVRRVLMLEDEDEWEWVGDVGLGLEREDDHWETIGDTVSVRASYAKVLQRQVV